MAINITDAGYGCYGRTRDATVGIRKAYASGTRKFLANNDWTGDPYPGARKYLYIVWDEDGVDYSGVVGEGDDTGVVLPEPTQA
jgi:hypothetical protein